MKINCAVKFKHFMKIIEYHGNFRPYLVKDSYKYKFCYNCEKNSSHVKVLTKEIPKSNMVNLFNF
uniref:Transposase n=1 Tax=Strongyloides papillosus TaxID=174720 RepID=A0A0N5BT91_STREA